MKNTTGDKNRKGLDGILFSILFTALAFITAGTAISQEGLEVIRNNWLLYSDAPNSLYQYLSNEGYGLLASRAGRVAAINTREEFYGYQADIKRKIWAAAGEFSSEEPLNATVTGIVKKDGYRIENVIYESLPGYFVTASLFIPDGLRKPAPAILFCSGHSSGAYRLPLYQQPLLNLVKKGFVVLAFDPVGQGERLQYFDPAKGESVLGGSTHEHSYPSPQVFLLGKSVARYFIRDGIRGIDYLVSRKEVDPSRIGVHGLSGGGTQTAYISAVDDRVVASAPAGYITSYRRLMESVGVQDGEQNMYHGILEGIDHADYLEARAPRPTLIMATTSDFFSIQGTRETYTEVKRIYDLLGKPDNIDITEDDYGHGYTRKNREKMYAFFQKYLDNPGSPSEEEVEYVPPRELQKTSTGQISSSLGGETVFSLNLKDAGRALKKLEESRDEHDRNTDRYLVAARELSGYREPADTDEPVFTGRIHRDGYFVEKYFLKGEGNYVIPYLLFIPDRHGNEAVILLHPSGKEAVVSPDQELEFLLSKGFMVLAPDMIGTGETGPGILTGDSEIDSISYNLWFTAVITGRSLTGLRAADVSKLTAILLDKHGAKMVSALAVREMAPVLLHAAAFNGNIKRIALMQPYSSYRSIIVSRFYKPSFVYGIVPGALNGYDLPDLAAALAPRKLMMLNVTDGSGLNKDTISINSDISIIRTGYNRKKADANLITGSFGSAGELTGYLGEWLK